MIKFKIYIFLSDVFEHGIVAQHQFEDDPHNNSNNHHNNNSVWFSDVDDSDFSSILNNVDTFSFGENIFFDDDNYSANCVVTSSSCDVSRCQFHQRSTSSFYACRSQKRKKRQSSCQSFLGFWNLRGQKLVIKCWWNWPQFVTLFLEWRCD